jgi:hypothetical protein
MNLKLAKTKFDKTTWTWNLSKIQPRIILRIEIDGFLGIQTQTKIGLDGS